jgi:hypothetical protein
MLQIPGEHVITEDERLAVSLAIKGRLSNLSAVSPSP